MKNKIQTEKAAKRHTDIQREPKRVPPRLEGIVKNTGIRPKRKKAKK